MSTVKTPAIIETAVTQALQDYADHYNATRDDEDEEGRLRGGLELDSDIERDGHFTWKFQVKDKESGERFTMYWSVCMVNGDGSLWNGRSRVGFLYSWTFGPKTGQCLD